MSGFVIQRTGMRPITLAPFGILLFAGAMWLLSASTSGSGSPDLTLALLLRGFGLGLLFVALTLVTLQGLAANALPFGIGLFNFGKQVGGLTGTALLQTYIDHQNVHNRTILASHLVNGDPAVDQRLKATANALANSVDSTAATKAALPLLQRALEKQVATISFDEAFFALVLLFAVAAPCLILSHCRQTIARPPSRSAELKPRPRPILWNRCIGRESHPDYLMSRVNRTRQG
ncbi:MULTISPECIES: hypothetical protein [unclassified Mesorhizobium]|uniref:hypothetical protein n=2 Tax=Mesorhizobium TaxID=68287 RepID=UPI00333932E5